MFGLMAGTFTLGDIRQLQGLSFGAGSLYKTLVYVSPLEVWTWLDMLGTVLTVI